MMKKKKATERLLFLLLKSDIQSLRLEARKLWGELLIVNG